MGNQGRQIEVSLFHGSMDWMNVPLAKTMQLSCRVITTIAPYGIFNKRWQKNINRDTK